MNLRLRILATIAVMAASVAATASTPISGGDRGSRVIRIWIAAGSKSAKVSQALHAQVKDAFFEWERVGIPLRFAFVEDSAGADVVVDWVDQFKEPISGTTVWTRDSQAWIVGGKITLAKSHNSGQPLSHAAVRAIALHEVGHLLGLQHNADSLSIMAPRVRVKSLSDGDRATMTQLYNASPSPSFR